MISYYENLIQIALHPQKPVLTDVMLETLSIIAYKQPVTKAEIEKNISEVMSTTKLEEMKYRLIKNLSKGYKQRVGLAQALFGISRNYHSG